MYEELRSDAFFHEFSSEEALLEFTEELDTKDLWMHAFATDLCLVPIGAETTEKNTDGLFDTTPVGTGTGQMLPETCLNIWNLTCSTEDLQDAVKHSGMLVKIGEYWYPLSEHALISVCARAENNARIAQKFTINELCVMWNLSWKHKEPSEKIRVLLRGNKVCTIRTKDYACIPQGEFFSFVTKKLHTMFDQMQFVSAAATHTITTLRYELTGKTKEDLTESYRDAVRKAGLSSLYADIRAYIDVSTGDTGENAAQIRPFLDIRGMLGGSIPLCPSKSATLMRHRGKDKQMEDYEEEVGSIYAKLREGMYDMKTLIETPIYHPAACLIRIGKKYHLPKAKVNEEAENYELFSADGSIISAFEIFCSCCEILSPEKTGDRRELAQSIEKVETQAMLLALDWKKYDGIGPVSW